MPRSKRKPRVPGGEPDPATQIVVDENDLFGQLSQKQGSILYLGKYTVEDIRSALERSGIFPMLREKGLGEFVIRIEPMEEFQQSLRVYHQQAAPETLLAEARLREAVFKPAPKMPEHFSDGRPRMLCIDWLMMQNPFRSFDPERPRLPGQEHPGLGVARMVLRLLKALCRLHHLAGILNFPEYFHNAYFYRRNFHFYNPQKEGDLYVLARDLQPLGIADMSWAIEKGCVRNGQTEEVYEWVSGVQILPLAAEVKEYFRSAFYRREVEETLASRRYILDKDKFAKVKSSLPAN